MEGEFWILKTPEQKANAAAAVANCPVSPDKPYRLKLEPYEENRRLAQNSLSHKWYSEVSTQGKEYTPEDVKSISKLRWGVPILCAEDEQFAAFWEKVKQSCPGYEDQIEAMRFIPVTSIMSVKQMSRYLSDFQRVMCQKYKLTDPSLMGLDELRMAARAA